MKNLFKDITKADELGLDLVHLTACPVSVKEVAKFAFGLDFNNHTGNPLISYDFKTVYGTRFGKTGDYQYDKVESLKAIKEYADE
jgi:hypothetical protein